MSKTKISAGDIANWETLDDIAASLEKRGLEPRPNLDRENGFKDELLIEIEENEYIALIDAVPGDEPSDYNKFQSSKVPTTFVSTRDFHTFSIIRRKRIIGGDKHGRLNRQKFSFDKEQITSGDRYTVLDKLNDIEYGNDSSLDSLFDTRQVVDEFYEGFESIRTDLVAEVNGIPGDRGDAKQRYVQVMLNRLIFLHFIQEKGLLGAGEDDYLLTRHDEFAADGDVQTDFYEPLFFKALAEEGFQSREFDRVPYLNGGLFSETKVEQNFGDARLGADPDESDDLYREILEFLDSWNWHVDERLDVVEPKNLSPAVLGHIFEQSVNQKEMGAYYTPEEITSFMSRESIHPRILDAVNEATGGDYREIDAIFGLDETATQGEYDSESVSTVAPDGGAITQQAGVDAVSAEDVEALYFDVLKELHVLDPAVGSGAFLLAAEDVLLDIYLHAIEFFEQLYEEEPFAVSDRIKDELAAVSETNSKKLYAKRAIILNNLYGVDIDDGAVEICKLRLWLSMVADIEDDPAAVDPLPNIDFNVRQGNTLVGFTELVEVNTDGDARLINYGAGIGESVQQKYDDVIEATEKHRLAQTKAETERWRDEAERRRRQHATSLNEKIVEKFHEAGIDSVSIDNVDVHSPFHWVIEFPTVYRDGGFDVVIGNPPYIRPHNIPEDIKRYLWQHFDAAEKKADIFVCFMQRAQSLAKSGGYTTYITSDSWLHLDSFESIRSDLIDTSRFDYIIDLPNGVFPDATVETCIYIATTTESPRAQNDINIIRASDLEQTHRISTLEPYAVPQERFRNTYKNIFDLSLTPDTLAIKERIEGEGVKLGSITKLDFGLKTGDDDKFIRTSKETVEDKQLLRGADIDRYTCDWDGEYVWYVPNKMKAHKDTARPGSPDRFETEKLLIRDTLERLAGTYDSNGYYVKDVLIVRSDSDYDVRFLTAIVNSKLMRWYYETSFPTLHVQRKELAHLPIQPIETDGGDHVDLTNDISGIPHTDSIEATTAEILERVTTSGEDVAHTALAELAEVMVALHQQRLSTTPQLDDYLELTGDGLPNNVAGAMFGTVATPCSGVDETPLTQTSDDLTGLRIEQARINRRENKMVLEVDISYKPGRGDPRPTDPYDRLAENEFETYDALVLSGVPTAQKHIFEDYIPTVVEKGDGFAGFRPEATKTNTLIDRLSDMVLPDTDELNSKQYATKKGEAEEITERITAVDRLIDQIVFNIYNLTPDDIDIINENY